MNKEQKTHKLTRWRMLLGEDAAESLDMPLQGELKQMDKVLAALYGEEGGNRHGGLGGSNPQVNRWLGDIRKYFPSSMVQMMQKDAYDRLGLKRMLLEPELLESLEPDVHLVASLINLKEVIPSQTKSTARMVVKKVADELQRKLRLPTEQAVRGALSRSVRNRRPKWNEIDWPRTIRANLKHYQPEHKSIIPHQLHGMGRKGRSLKDVILCIDQSGSMATSLVYASIFGAVMASIPALNVRMVFFDTAVADLTEKLRDPVDLLFGANLGGGTDIQRALTYCQSHIRRPQDTILVLITDLYEGGNREKLIQRAASVKATGAKFITLLALSDEGKPFYDHEMAREFAALGIPTFACTPDQFPVHMAEALR
jgi:Mg-chelatase subunit ChlD